MATHTRTCNVCEAMCGLLVTVDAGRITDIRGDPDDALSRGHLCPKGPAMREVQEDPDRLRSPVRRTQNGWERIGWDQAFSLVAERLDAIRREHGPDAIGFYAGNPIVHNHGSVMFYQAFAGALGTRNRFDANSLDANPKLFSCLQMFGEVTSIPVPDIDRTDYLLMLGANPIASGGSLMSLGDPRGRIADLRKRGGRLVVLDPRRTETARKADEHHFLRPGGDAAFLLAFLHVLFAEDLTDEAAIAETSRGVETVRALAARFPPERVAAATGVDPAIVRRLARELAGARRAVAYGRVGTSVNAFGPLASWLLDVVNVVTGNFDREGGAMFATPAVDLAALGRRLDVNHYDRYRSRVRGLPELGGTLPAATMAEEMETPGDGRIRAFVTLAGNPVLSSPGSERLEAALAQLEFMVSIDLYVNETSRHAHVILPPRYAFERSHYDLALPAFAVRNVARFSEPTLPPDPEGRDDWEILYELGMRLGGLKLGNAVLDAGARLAWRFGRRLSADRLLDLFLRMGPYRLSLAKLRKAPHGLDLGPLLPSRKRTVRTPSGRVELAPPILVGDVPRLERYVEESAAAGGLMLIGRRHMRTNNSWMHNVRSLVKGPDRAALLMHPGDAVRLGLESGRPVRVQGRAGAVTARLETTEDIMPGVVSLPHGYGHAAAADTLKVAGTVAGPNVNVVTDERLVEPLLGTAILNGVPVTVQAVAPA